MVELKDERHSVFNLGSESKARLWPAHHELCMDEGQLVSLTRRFGIC